MQYASELIEAEEQTQKVVVHWKWELGYSRISGMADEND